MERVTFDGLETCPNCRRKIGIWKEEKGRRIFEEHFTEYPKHCEGKPQQTERGKV